ncbi:DUF721 domain-containing protein [Labrys sp. KNU-23]|uniref:DUF721 domain-containing protein n=1 Tax=Labrys sp. KNU-23 TaxID=2789216 RepID=UPI00165CD207|nr:DciA family protein [Labrys sp. KNU-23]
MINKPKSQPKASQPKASQQQASPQQAPFKRRSARPFADLVGPALADALKARGFATADIIGHWPDIVGARLSAHSLPVKIQWPPRPKGEASDAAPVAATLILRVESAFALEVEMSASQIIERINAVFGWRCIGKLRLKQGPVDHPVPRERPKIPDLPPEASRQLADDLSGIENPGLREALERLGRQVRGAPRRTKPVTPT